MGQSEQPDGTSAADTRKRRPVSSWLIAGVIYCLLLALVCAWLFGQAGEEDWRGAASGVLAILTWGGHPWELLPIVLLSAALNGITGGLSDGIVQGYIGVFIVYFGIGAMQIGLLRLLYLGVRRAVRGVAVRRR